MKDMLDKNHIRDPSSLYRIARKMFDSRYSEVSTAWCEVILSAIRILPLDLILNEVHMTLVNKRFCLGR